MEWDEAKIATLTRLWNVEKKTHGQCAEAIGCSVNAIAGKAHRLGLERRPSPIKQTPGVAPKRSYAGRKQAKAMSPFEIERRRLAAENRVASKPTPKQEARVVHLGRVKECCWPTSKGRPWTFCCEPCAAGKPYCRAHVALGYVKLRDRRDDATGYQDRTGAARRSPEARLSGDGQDDSSLNFPSVSDGAGGLFESEAPANHAEAA